MFHVKQKTFLLINPPIYDFSAYDLWSKPIGLLSIARMLQNNGARVQLIDCLDRLSPLAPYTKSNMWGCGRYFASEVAKPEILKTIPRKYKRYGLPIETFQEQLKKMHTPDAVLVTSGMTYWYPGVNEVIQQLKRAYPDAPVILGGIYATLCPEHAVKNSGADHVVCGAGISPLIDILKRLELFERHFDRNFSDFPPQAYELYGKLEYAAIRTTMGCPFRCSYCAIDKFSNNGWEKRKPDSVIGEITGILARGIRNIAFYDDALFVDSSNHIIPILERFIGLVVKANFHSPNGLHARYITPRLAKLLRDAGFVMPRLSLETSNKAVQERAGGKIKNEEFISAANYLKEAGYSPGDYGAYILIGMDNQDSGEIEQSIRFAHDQGARVFLAEYSPIPGTRDWDNIKDKLPSKDPLWHNNSIFPLLPISHWQKVRQLKNLSIQLNKCFT